MGLSISYYRQIKPASADFLARYNEARARGDDSDWDLLDSEGYVVPYINPHFPGRAEGIESGMPYLDSRADYFSASYSGYNRWRRELAALVGIMDLEAWWEDPQPGTFAELLNFTDCEGTIGPVVSAKLAQDFAKWQEHAEAFTKDNFWHLRYDYGAQDSASYWLKRYGRWRTAFEVAADGGMVRFH